MRAIKEYESARSGSVQIGKMKDRRLEAQCSARQSCVASTDDRFECPERRSFWSRPLTAEGIGGAATESNRRAPIGLPIDGRDDGDDPPARQRVDKEHEAEVDEQIPPRDRTRERQIGLVHGQGRNACGAHGDRCEHQVEAMDR
jgi:hypothetical protein